VRFLIQTPVPPKKRKKKRKRIGLYGAATSTFPK
jgi:hypothetical protein